MLLELQRKVCDNTEEKSDGPSVHSLPAHVEIEPQNSCITLSPLLHENQKEEEEEGSQKSNNLPHSRNASEFGRQGSKFNMQRLVESILIGELEVEAETKSMTDISSELQTQQETAELHRSEESLRLALHGSDMDDMKNSQNKITCEEITKAEDIKAERLKTIFDAAEFNRALKETETER